ncbi:MAG: type II toxin-antitoxin system prevent-host-death family antitoxin, partial [Desulfobulbaceae bacterium]|nr:type II toxin-antitoxin system prevent-host-death family antitoxin [Desulfobulbaceae bacterium]
MRKYQRRKENMKTASVGEIQKNFAKVLSGINNGQEIIITKRGKPVARIV